MTQTRKKNANGGRFYRHPDEGLLVTTVLQVGPYINDFKTCDVFNVLQNPSGCQQKKLHQKLPFFQVDFGELVGDFLVGGMGRVWDFSSHRPRGNEITNLINQTS